MKNILLVDSDSTIPNLPLMKLSRYHKEINDNVKLVQLNLPYYPNKKHTHHYLSNLIDRHDKIYCSVIFDGTKDFIHGNNIIYGGTGYSLDIILPDYIENIEPDYSIYPDNTTSYGFISRGCIRKCSFCKVPQKEGWIRQVNTIDKIIKHKQVKFLDNNFLALPNHKEILNELIERKIKCQFNQGLDIRLLNKTNSILLSKLNYWGEYVFAFDDIGYMNIIEENLPLLFWRKNWQIKFFVYCHPKMKLSNILKRVEYLKKEKCLPYIMRDISCWQSLHKNFYTDIAAWCNQVHLFKKMNFDEFIEKRHKSKTRIENSRNLYYSNLT